jgi:hypothetical protein
LRTSRLPPVPLVSGSRRERDPREFTLEEWADLANISVDLVSHAGPLLTMVRTLIEMPAFMDLSGDFGVELIAKYHNFVAAINEGAEVAYNLRTEEIDDD